MKDLGCLDREYVNIFLINPLSGSTYIKLHLRLRNSMNVLINIKSKDMLSLVSYQTVKSIKNTS